MAPRYFSITNYIIYITAHHVTISYQHGTRDDIIVISGGMLLAPPSDGSCHYSSSTRRGL